LLHSMYGLKPVPFTQDRVIGQVLRVEWPQRRFRVPILGDGPVAANSLRRSVAAPFDPSPLVSFGDGAGPSSSGVLSAAQIPGGLHYVLRLAEIAPIAFIRAKGDDLFSLGRKMH